MCLGGGGEGSQRSHVVGWMVDGGMDGQPVNPGVVLTICAACCPWRRRARPCLSWRARPPRVVDRLWTDSQASCEPGRARGREQGPFRGEDHRPAGGRAQRAPGRVYRGGPCPGWAGPHDVLEALKRGHKSAACGTGLAFSFPSTTRFCVTTPPSPPKNKFF